MKKTALVLTLMVCILLSFMPVLAGGATTEIVLDGAVGITDTGDYYADVTIENPAHNAVLVVALYNNKVLTGYDEICLTAATDRIQFTIDAPAADSAKFFVLENWDSAKPLGNVKEIQIPDNPDYIVVTDGANLTGTYRNVIIAPEIGDGEVTLSGATITGDLKVQGGGSNSIHLNNCTVEGKVVVEKENGQPPRLNLIGTTLELVEAKTETLIEGEGDAAIRKVVATADVVAASAVVQKIEIPTYAEERVDITIDGSTPVDVEVNTSVGVEVIGGEVTISTALEKIPSGVVRDGDEVTHLHKWSEPKTTQPTCEEAGTAIYSCNDTNCSVSKTEIIPALGHQYGDWQKYDKEKHIHTCARDNNHTETEEHKWDEGTVVKDATKEEEGIKRFTCKICGETKEETIPVLSDIQFTFSYDQYHNPIITWTNNDYSNYYYEFEDSNGKSAANGWSEPGKSCVILPNLPTPESGTQTYSFVLYASDSDYNVDWDNAFARLDDCVTVTISGEAFPYSMSFHTPEQGKHTITTGADIPANALRLQVWTINGRRANASVRRNSNVINAGEVSTENNSRAQLGDSMDLRIADTEIPNPQKLMVTMTPPSKKTYQENDTAIYTFMESDGLKLAWKDAVLAEDEKYIVTVKEPSSEFSTSKTYLPFGAFLVRENVKEGIVTAQVQKALKSEWNPNGDVYPEAEVANITLNGTNPTYTIQRQEDGSYHFVSDMTGGAWVYEVYDENGNISYMGNAVDGTIDSYANFKDGCKVVARYITWEVNEDKTFAEISLSNRVEMQQKQDGLMMIQEGDFLRVTWPNYGSYQYSVGVDDKNGNVSLMSVSDGATEYSNFGSLLPMPESGENIYDLVLYGESSSDTVPHELDRIENAVVISVTGAPLSYEVNYNTPEIGTHTVNFDLAGYPEGSGLRGFWRTGTGVFRKYKMHAPEFDTVSGTLKDGSYCDYRIISPVKLENQKVTLTMTPPSVKTYTASKEGEIFLVQEGNSIEVRWSEYESANGYTWALIEGEKIQQLDFTGKNVFATTDLKPCLTRIESGTHTYDFVLYEYDESAEDCIGKELGRLENAVEVTIDGAPIEYALEVTNPENGQYQISLNQATVAGNIYLTRWNRGKRNYSSIYISDGSQMHTETTFMGSIQNGDIYDLQLLSRYVLEGQTLKATITEPSQKTYTE